MKHLFALSFVFILFAACESNRADYVQLYREDGLPVWVGKVFSNPNGYWAGYNDEKGYYSSGEANYKDQKIAVTAAELDAKKRLLDFISGSKNEWKDNQYKHVLVGFRRVDRFIADDGTVYVLMFVSKKNARKILAEN
ncbi:MAG: hypothetical protein IJP90_08315 [Treponema sp.]|nr:hypothetical protein [Treponema sp.]MBR0099708.1 hypothetical protein [Treponema sp.]